MYYFPFKPNNGRRKPILLINRSYIAKQPVNVNTAIKTNFAIIGISIGNIMKEPRYRKII